MGFPSRKRFEHFLHHSCHGQICLDNRRPHKVPYHTPSNLLCTVPKAINHMVRDPSLGNPDPFQEVEAGRERKGNTNACSEVGVTLLVADWANYLLAQSALRSYQISHKGNHSTAFSKKAVFS